MRFHSVLFDQPPSSVVIDELEEPGFFRDLNLDQVVESITAGRDEYQLKPFFYTPLRDVEAVYYRHEVFRDLEDGAVMEAIQAFSRRMQEMRAHLAQVEKLYYTSQKKRWFVEAVEVYCDAVRSLAEGFASLGLTSRGLRAFRDYILDYTASVTFTSLISATRELKDALASVKYCVHIAGNRVTVSRYEGEPDFSAEVVETFAKFKHGAVGDHRVKLTASLDMDPVEARVFELVAQLYPDVSRALDEYRVRHRDYLDQIIGTFDREVQFYLAYLEHAKRFRSAGLPFCYPHVSVRAKHVFAHDAFDLALANKLVPQGSEVVCNSFDLTEPERVIVVTGPNQGGKTTFARMFGQLHHLANLGCLVPAKAAHLSLPDHVFAHFEREENLATLRGKLEDELVASTNPPPGDQRQRRHHERELQLDLAS